MGQRPTYPNYPSDLAPGVECTQIIELAHDAGQLAWSPDGQWLAIGPTTVNDPVRIWDCAQLCWHGSFMVPGGCSRLAWAPDSQRIAVGISGGPLEVWDGLTGQQLRRGNQFGSGWWDIAWAPDGRQIAAIPRSRNPVPLLLWDPQADETSRYDIDGYDSFSLAWSPDGAWIAVGTQQGAVALLDWKSGRHTLANSQHTSLVLRPHWRSPIDEPDAIELITASYDRTIGLWRKTGDQFLIRGIWEGYSSPVDNLCLSPSGQLLASRTADGDIRLWWLDPPKCLCSTGALGDPHPPLPPNLVFHPSSPRLATVNPDWRSITIWDVDEALLYERTCVRTIRHTTAKVVLLGKSGVGKTSLGWRLAHGDFQHHDSTHGQKLWMVDQLRFTRADGCECETLLWDLAGQPDYKLVHSLFLDDADLAVLLYDAADRQEPLGEVEYWLKALDKAGNRCPILLVGARSDRGYPSLTPDEVLAFCQKHQIKGHVLTSAVTGEGLPALAQKIRETVRWEERPASVTTPLYKRIKDGIIALQERVTSTSLTHSLTEWRTRVAQEIGTTHTFSDSELLVITDHLAHHGFVVVLSSPAGEQCLVRLPELINNLGASIVLEARRDPNGLGTLIEQKLRDDKGTLLRELQGLSDWEQEQLLETTLARFIANNICFRQQMGRHTYLIFPALIHEKPPATADIAFAEGDLYTITGQTETIYAALVVLLGYTQHFTRTEQWRNHARYEFETGEICGFHIAAERNGEMDLRLYYGASVAEHTQKLFQALFERFLAQQRANVKRYPSLHCNACKRSLPIEEIVRRSNAGEPYIHCSNCGSKHSLQPITKTENFPVEQTATVDAAQADATERTRYEAALVRLRRTATAPQCFVSYAWGNPKHETWVRKRLVPDLKAAGLDVWVDVEKNANAGQSIPRFVEQADKADFVLIVGTPLYRDKCDATDKNTTVGAEMKIISQRLMRTDARTETVIPLLLDGEKDRSLPLLARDKIYIDFRSEGIYFAHLFDLVRTLYGIPPTEVQDLMKELEGPAPGKPGPI